jgi:hypothetical protein
VICIFVKRLAFPGGGGGGGEAVWETYKIRNLHKEPKCLVINKGTVATNCVGPKVVVDTVDLTSINKRIVNFSI